MKRSQIGVIVLWGLLVVSHVLVVGCGRESAPTSPTQTNVPTASSTGENTGGVDVSTGSTTTSDSSGDSGVTGVLGGNNKDDGYIPSGQSVDWVSVLNEGNFERNVFVIGYRVNVNDSPFFFPRGTGFAAGFSNVLWTNAHVIESMENGISAFEDDTTFVPTAYRGGLWSLESSLSLTNVRTIKHPRYDGTTSSEDVAAYIFADEPFKHEPLPSLLPMRFVDELAVGQPVGTLGFPEELWVLTGGWWNETVVPTFKDGTLSALKSLNTDIYPTEVGRLLQYNLTTTRGTSGSPVFDHTGFIIGITHASHLEFVADTSGVVVSVNPANAGEGIRVDALHELIPPVYNSPASARRVVDARTYPYSTYQPFPE